MSLSEYFTEIVKLIEKYAHSGLIVGSDFNNDYRTEKSGVIKGNLLFNDGSKLYFTEYIDTSYGVEKLTYSYHYQNKRGKLIFRYDNARHQPLLSFKSHKHLSDETIINSDPPELRFVLDEILRFIL